MAEGVAALGLTPLVPLELLLRCRWRRRFGQCGQRGLVLCPQISHQLGNLPVRERVTEWRHLLPAVQDLMGDLLRGPILVFAQVSQWWAFLSADPFGAVAMGTILLAKEERTGQLVGLCGMGFLGGQDGRGQGDSED